MDAFHILRIGVEHARVPHAAIGEQLSRIRDRRGEVRRPVKRQTRRQFLPAERILRTDSIDFSDQHLRLLRHIHSGHLRDVPGALTDDFRIEFPVDLNDVADLFRLLRRQNPGAAAGEFGLHFIINAVDRGDRLFGRADHAVVEGLAHQHGTDRGLHVARIAHDHRGIAGADADRRSAARISRLHHARAAGGENQCDVGVAHEMLAHRHRRFLDPSDDVFGSAGLDRSLKHNSRRRNRALLGPRVRTENDSVAGLQRQKRFENRGRSRVGRRHDSGDDAHRFSDPGDAHGFVFFQNAAGFGVAVFVVDIFRRVMILDDLVFHDAHAGLGNRHLRQRNPFVVRGQRGGGKDRIDLFLRVLRKLDLRGFHFGDQGVKRFFLRRQLSGIRNNLLGLLICLFLHDSTPSPHCGIVGFA